MKSVSTDAGQEREAGRREPDSSRPGGLKSAVTIDTEQVRGHLDEVVRSTVEQTLNQLLDDGGMDALRSRTRGAVLHAHAAVPSLQRLDLGFVGATRVGMIVAGLG